METICLKEKCMGCFACYNICKKHAITMEEDETYGYIYPKIDKSKCVNCNLCKTVCPALNKIKKNIPQKTYAVWAKDNEMRSRSTSGGAAAIFSEKIIDENGIVYGVALEQNVKIRHIRIDNFLDLDKIKGSKYVHSYVEEAYSLVEKDLKENKKVLFTGTPCQIAGLKLFLKKEYENLITVDIICHGVPSQKFLREQIKEDIKNLEVDNVIFRKNNKYLYELEKNNKTIYNSSREDCAYCQGFDRNLTLRTNCYQCDFATKDRVSDITLGDFWGIDKEEFIDEIDKGISVVLVNTNKGLKFFEECKDRFVIFERKLDEAVNGNEHLRHPSIQNKNIKKFRKEYNKYGKFTDTCFNSLKYEIRKDKLKAVLKNNKFIYQIYKSVKKGLKRKD